MTDFKGKMHQIRFRLGELTALPRPPSWIWGPTSKEREREGGEGRRGEGRRGKRKGGKGRGGEGKGHEPTHYLEEVYAYATNSSAVDSYGDNTMPPSRGGPYSAPCCTA